MSKEKILEYFSDINYAYNDCTRLETLKNMLNELEDVVRCKDCKYWNKVDELDRVQYGECHKGFRLATFLSENFFCADGERNDG